MDGDPHRQVRDVVKATHTTLYLLRGSLPSKLIGCVPSIHVHLSYIRVAQPIVQVFPLPVEGAETKVLADDQEVANYMIDLGDLLETVSSYLFSILTLRKQQCLKLLETASVGAKETVHA